MTWWSILLCFVFSTLAMTHVEASLGVVNDTIIDVVNSPLPRRQNGALRQLVIMPLGASITEGYEKGIDPRLHQGYRKPLRDALQSRGYSVDMVGSQSNGEFEENQHEGYPGKQIDEVGQLMLPTLMSAKPNLVLILVGSNDCFKAREKYDMGYAKATKGRMKAVVDRIFKESSDVLIILATLPPTLEAKNEPYIQAANEGFKELVTEYRRQQKKIRSVDMYRPEELPKEDYSDTIHFTPKGYGTLASIWLNGILEAVELISEPVTDKSGKFKL